MTEPWLSVDEGAEHLRVIKDTVYSWIAAGGMPSHTIGRCWRFQGTEVDEGVCSGGKDDQPPSSSDKAE
ncbi:DNA-binding protein [Methylobacterium radiotolerans]|nr:DNA-binding protein [Methylobacterium radiotolerans]